MAEKIVLITGATAGIGKVTALKFAENNYHVVIHGRNSKKIEETLQEVRQKSDNNQIDDIKADLSSLDEVRKMAEEIKDRYDHIDILVNNAGIGSGPKGNEQRQVSKDGYELRFAVNYLAHFLLTNQLLPLLSNSEESRIINLSSAAQNHLDFDNLMLESGYSGSRAYGQSKLAMAIFTSELADRLKEKKIITICLHPGSLLDTQMVRESFGQSWGSPEEGAEAIFHLATSIDIKQNNGGYFNQKKPSKADAQAYDKKAKSKLWEVSERMVGLS